MPKVKFYAVKRGRVSPAIHTDWKECKQNIDGFSGAMHRSFNTMDKAARWLDSVVQVTLNPRPPYIETPRRKHFPPEPPLDLEDNATAAVIPALDLAKTSRELELIRRSQEKAQSSTVEGGVPLVQAVRLSEEQQIVMDRVKSGQNVFFTGSAGTGKSVLLRSIIDHFGGPRDDSIGVTATTGIAAVNIGGVTLHSWAGIGINYENPKKTPEEVGRELGGKMLGQPAFSRAKKRWENVQALIVDEISMLDGGLFDVLESMARRIRRNETPFGGIQLIICGDFCQLPPVTRNPESLKFAFDAKTWRKCVPNVTMLTKVFRQKDQAFADMLNRMRLGDLNADMIAQFTALSREVTYEDGIEPTELFSRRFEVESANNSRLHKLPSDLVEYKSSDRPGIDSNGKIVSITTMVKLLERMLAMSQLQLKVGAQVMLIKNIVQGVLVNGSLGKVVDFRPEAGYVFEDPPEGAPRGFQPTERATGPLYPVVQFTNGVQRLVVPVTFDMNNAAGEMEASRTQVPLILAWGLSIHKSQGQTLERVKVNLRSIFECGQAYVAISRATKMETLQITGFTPAKVMAHPRVLNWMEESDVD